MQHKAAFMQIDKERIPVTAATTANSFIHYCVLDRGCRAIDRYWNNVVSVGSWVPTTSLISADSRTRCNHQYKFKCILASTTAYRNSFYPRTIPQWNDLDKESAEATTIDCFKSRLH